MAILVLIINDIYVIQKIVVRKFFFLKKKTGAKGIGH